jgi:hypothetical protein
LARSRISYSIATSRTCASRVSVLFREILEAGLWHAREQFEER